MYLILIFSMIFMHYIGDYIIQTDFISKSKNSNFWKDKEKMYKYDYIPILFFHSFSWSFCIHIPLIWLLTTGVYDKTDTFIVAISIIINAFIHMIIDNLKANVGTINLIIDQIIHIFQIIVVFIIFYSRNLDILGGL